MMFIEILRALWERWRGPKVDPVALSLPLPQALILIALDGHITEFEPTYSELLTPKELYEKLHPYSRGEWHEFCLDLETLQERMLLVVQNDKVLLSPRGSYIARQRQKKLYDA